MRTSALDLLTPDPAAFRCAPPTEAAVWRRPAGPLVELLELANVDDLLQSRPLNRQMVSVINGGARVAATGYTWAGRPIQPGFGEVVRPNRIGALLRDGATVVLESLHRTWRPVAQLCRRLSHETGIPVSANAYLTPPSAQGFAHHYDTHGVLIVQTAGSKTWQLHRPIFEDPLEHQPFRAGDVDERTWQQLRTGTPFLETTLRPGDLLWIPRGWIHNGFATDEVSLHVSLSFASVSKFWIAQQLLKRLDQRAEFRRELAWGFAQDASVRRATLDDTAKLLAEAFSEPASDLTSEELADSYSEFFLEAARPVTADAFGPAAGPDLMVRTVAESVIRRSWLAGGELRLHLADTVLTIPAPAAQAVAALLEADSEEPWTPAALMADAGSAGLAEQDALDLVATLLRWGIVRNAGRM